MPVGLYIAGAGITEFGRSNRALPHNLCGYQKHLDSSILLDICSTIVNSVQILLIPINLIKEA
jgi:hypothetical protein